MHDFRFELASAEQLAAIAAVPALDGVALGAPVRSLHRDRYLDTPDDALRRRGVLCRLRLAGDRRVLLLRLPPAAGAERPETVAATVDGDELAPLLAGTSAPARRLRSLVDPALLAVRADVEVERVTRGAGRDWLGRPRAALHLDRLTVRRNASSATFYQLCGHRLRGTDATVERLARALEREHGLRPAPPSRERAELAARWAPRAAERSARPDAPHDERGGQWPAVRAINPELSLLAFQERVLTLAEDETTPLAERLRFLAIVAANVDEFFAVRVAGLRADALEPNEEQGADGLAPDERDEAIAAAARALVTRVYRCHARCAAALVPLRRALLRWTELDAAEQAVLRARFDDEVYPALTPFAMTVSPGHPIPHRAGLTLNLAVVLAAGAGGPVQLAELELPTSLPRLLPVGEGAAQRGWITVEELVRANVAALYPQARVEGAHAFRVTYGRDVAFDEEEATSLIDAVDAATRRLPAAVVRVEVERAMPAMVRGSLLASLRPAGGARAPDCLFECDGPLDLRLLADVAPPDDASLHYPPFRGRRVVPKDRSIIEAIGARDVLAHHPFDRFSATVARFLREAADDPAVTTVKITLYRTGDRSPIVDALVRAASRGKQVVAFVELKASFDEQRNVSAARAIERAGGHVVYGLVGLKNHAKMALVVRREAGRLRRYVHVGTGNYNARTALYYTDLSLLSADPALAEDVTTLFNALTGSSRPPERLDHGALVAPLQLAPALVQLIDREAAHARAGRPAGVRIKVNGLSDPEIVQALYRASQDGVPIELAVRGVCTLRPAIPGLSERIRVVSTVGRLLEHSRIYHFAGGGESAYYIGSADLRPRNLRRRVELLVPVRDPQCAARLDRLLSLYLADATAWELTASGDYVRASAAGPAAQTTLLAAARPRAGEGSSPLG